jgi:hypothetical protein
MRMEVRVRVSCWRRVSLWGIYFALPACGLRGFIRLVSSEYCSSSSSACERTRPSSLCDQPTYTRN